MVGHVRVCKIYPPLAPQQLRACIGVVVGDVGVIIVSDQDGTSVFGLYLSYGDRRYLGGRSYDDCSSVVKTL